MTASHHAPRALADLDAEERARLRRVIRVVATDVDGTLTTRGKIDRAVARAVESLAALGVEVLPVSGRPAGELQGLVRYLPGVRRAIAENGLLVVVPDRAPRWLDAPPDLERLRGVGRALNGRHAAGLEPTADAYCRLGDLAFERAGRDEAELARLRAAAEGLGAHLIWSNVHVHLSERPPDKGEAVLRLLAEDGIPGAAAMCLGDAPNDAGLFMAGRFGLTVGTADVLPALLHFAHAPSHVAAHAEGAAFVEAARLLGAEP